MNAFLDNWLLRRAMSEPRGGEGPSIGYQTFGSPTIANGKMTLSQNDSGIIPLKMFHPGSSTWEIRTRIKVNTLRDWQGIIISLTSSLVLTRILWFMPNGYSVGVYAGRGSGWDVFLATDIFSLPTNVWYDFRIRFTGTAYYLDYSTDGINFTNHLLATTSEALNDFYPLFGCTTEAGNNIDGEYDLNATAIYIDGQLWWKATPYIAFADPAVEAICVQNFSSDGIGLTMQDAAAVTSQQFGTTFRGNTQITSFDELQYFTGLGTLPANALRDCSALTSVVLPDNLSTIGLQAFLNDAALSGTIIIPSSVQNCGEIIFSSCVSIVNFYVLSTQNIGLDKWTNYNEFGAGSGVFYSKGSASQPGSEYAFAFRDICIEGSVKNTTSSRTIFHNGNSIVTIRVRGDVTINANGFVRSNAIKFIEVGGNIISPGNNFANNGSSVILHFGKTDGLACAPSVLDDTASSFNSRYDKIYVGSGESQAADQAVLNQYLADPDWAQYSSKLDLWYNYNGEYKNWPTIPTA